MTEQPTLTAYTDETAYTATGGTDVQAIETGQPVLGQTRQDGTAYTDSVYRRWDRQTAYIYETDVTA